MPFPKIRLEIEKYTWRINGWGKKMIDCQSTEAISINGTGWSSWATNAEFFYFVPSPVLSWSRAHVHIHYATKCLIMQRWWYVGRPSRKRINMLCNANEEQQLSGPFSQATAAQRGGRHFDINRRVLPAFDPLGLRMCNSDGDKSTKQIFFFFFKKRKKSQMVKWSQHRNKPN